MGPNEVVVAAQQVEVFFQPLLGACVAQCPSQEIGRALPNGQIEPLDERRVQLRRVLRVKQSFFETPRRSEHFSSFDLHDTIVPSSFENLTVETSDPEDATDDLVIELEAIGDDQWKTLEIHPVRKVTKQGKSVPVASSSHDGRRPETRPDLDRCEDPRRLFLPAGERADLIGLNLRDRESGGRSAVEPPTRTGRPLKPASDGVPGNPLHPSDRGDADTLDSEGRDLIESGSTMLETVVGCAPRRTERFSAAEAPVSVTLRRLCSVESVAYEASGLKFSVQRTFGVETAKTLHLAWALPTRQLRHSNPGSNSTTYRS